MSLFVEIKLGVLFSLSYTSLCETFPYTTFDLQMCGPCWYEKKKVWYSTKWSQWYTGISDARRTLCRSYSRDILAIWSAYDGNIFLWYYIYIVPAQKVLIHVPYKYTKHYFTYWHSLHIAVEKYHSIFSMIWVKHVCVGYLDVMMLITGLSFTRQASGYGLVWYWRRTVGGVGRTSSPWSDRWRPRTNSQTSPTHSRAKM